MWKVIRAHFSDVLLSLHLCGFHTAGSVDLMKNSISEAQLRDLKQRCPNINELGITQHHLRDIELGHLPKKLVRLGLTSCLTAGDWFHGIDESLPFLTDLDLGKSAKITDADLQRISKCTLLRSLLLNGCYRVSNAGIERVAKNLLQLQTLDLRETGCDDLALHHISMHLKCLEKLNLGLQVAAPVLGIAIFSTVGLINSLSLMKSLKCLHLSYCCCDDKVLEAIKHLPNLIHLNVSHTNVTIAGVALMDERCHVICDGD